MGRCPGSLNAPGTGWSRAELDGSSWADHATHVSGTIGAAGMVATAMGMAPGAQIDSYDWTNDLGEMTGRAMALPGEAGKIQISNHSYVYAAGGTRPRVRTAGTGRGATSSLNTSASTTITAASGIVCASMRRTTCR